VKIINVTPDYRVVARDALNIGVERLTDIPQQPTQLKKSSGPMAPVWVPHSAWREIGVYGRTFSGLQAALKSIILEAAIDGLAPSSELADFAFSLREVAANIDQALSPQISSVSSIIGD
jgi:hypothetical protein